MVKKRINISIKNVDRQAQSYLKINNLKVEKIIKSVGGTPPERTG